MPPPRWSCECCCTDRQDYTSIEIDDSSVCVDCVKKMFDDALKFEHNYPPQWAGPLHPSEFSHIFSEDYIQRYEQKEIEYKMPPSKRIYCQHVLHRTSPDGVESSQPCGNFLGARKRRAKSNLLVLGQCESCRLPTCMVCDQITLHPPDILQHDCPGKSNANEQRAKAFEGLKRGKDWQQCPSPVCGRRIELSAACNHMTCQCGMGFCFICGKEAEGDSDHWTKGGCPRYNQPGDPDEEYDGHYESDDESDDGASEADVLEHVRDLFSEAEGDPESPPAEELRDPNEVEIVSVGPIERRTGPGTFRGIVQPPPLIHNRRNRPSQEAPGLPPPSQDSLISEPEASLSDEDTVWHQRLYALGDFMLRNEDADIDRVLWQSYSGALD